MDLLPGLHPAFSCANCMSACQHPFRPFLMFIRAQYKGWLLICVEAMLVDADRINSQRRKTTQSLDNLNACYSFELRGVVLSLFRLSLMPVMLFFPLFNIILRMRVIVIAGQFGQGLALTVWPSTNVIPIGLVNSKDGSHAASPE